MKGTRTPDNLVVTQVLSQLSYHPSAICCRHISTSAYAIENTVVSTELTLDELLLATRWLTDMILLFI